MGVDLTANLENWADVEAAIKPSGLLLGNGASIVVSSDFAYRSLYDRSTPFLTAADRRLFTRFKTSNFEELLRALATTASVLDELGLDHTEIDARYASIHAALIQVVHAVHIAWTPHLRDACLRAIRGYLRTMRAVFSTNYDLLVYWAMMSEGRAGLADFLDFFWAGWPPRFDRFDLAVRPSRSKATRVYFMHGGLHIYRDSANRSAKLVANGRALLDQFASRVLPEYVAEGTWTQKAATIAASDYLSFALASFARFADPLIVFGHSLNKDSDGHLLNAMKNWGARSVAISVHPSGGAIVDKKKHYVGVLPANIEPRFFDATTHPLAKLKCD